MKCAKAQDLFSSYLEKTIQPPMGVAFEQHLAECARCKAEYAMFHATTVVLDELPQLEPPPDMHALIMARVEQARRAAPSRVGWLPFDWQSVFTLRVLARAVAMGAALLLVFAMVVQLVPHSKKYIGAGPDQRYSKRLPDETDVLHRANNSRVTAEYADVGGGLEIRVTADTCPGASTIYFLRLGARNNQSIPVRVYLLPDGSPNGGVRASDLTNVLYDRTVTPGAGAAMPVWIAPLSSSRKARVAMVTWDSEGRSLSEFVFMPSVFGSVAKGASLSVTDAGVCDVLSSLTSDYGTVILTPGDSASRIATVAMNATSADDAMGESMRQAGLSSELLGPSIYEVN